MLQDKRGFTLIELLIALLIIAVVAAIAIPSYISMLRAAREAKVISLLKQWQQGQEQFNFSYGGYTMSYDELELEGFIGGGSISIPDYVFDMAIGTFARDGTGKGKKGRGKGVGKRAPSPFNPRVAWWGTAQPKLASPQIRYFYTDQTGIIITKIGAPPAPGDPKSIPLGKQ